MMLTQRFRNTGLGNSNNPQVKLLHQIKMITSPQEHQLSESDAAVLIIVIL